MKKGEEGKERGKYKQDSVTERENNLSENIKVN